MMDFVWEYISLATALSSLINTSMSVAGSSDDAMRVMKVYREKFKMIYISGTQ